MEFFTKMVEWITNNAGNLLQIIGGFAVIATLTPNKADDKIAQIVLDVVNFLGGNLGKAKNDPNK